MQRVVVMVSGNGTNLQVLIDDVHANPAVASEIVLVVCSTEGARALGRAEVAGIPTAVVAMGDPPRSRGPGPPLGRGGWGSQARSHRDGWLDEHRHCGVS